MSDEPERTKDLPVSESMAAIVESIAKKAGVSVAAAVENLLVTAIYATGGALIADDEPFPLVVCLPKEEGAALEAIALREGVKLPRALHALARIGAAALAGAAARKLRDARPIGGVQ